MMNNLDTSQNSEQLKNDDYDPLSDLAAEPALPVYNAMLGRSPAGFLKVRVEMAPMALIKLIGYDPRGLSPVRKGTKVIETSRHVSRALADLQQDVQRSIDPEKVAEMVSYLVAAVSGGAYADWAELDVVTVTPPRTDQFKVDHLVLLPTSAEYFIIDGQHRFCALIDFVRDYPELAKKFTMGMAIAVLEPDLVKEWAGQGFHDKNYLRATVKATKALAVDARDPHNVLTKSLHQHPVIVAGGGVNVTKDAIAAAAPEMVSHAVLYKFVRGFCEGRRGVDKGALKQPHLTDQTFEQMKAEVSDYLFELSNLLPTWTDANRRAEFLFRSSPAWQALGVIGHLLQNIDDEDERRDAMRTISEKRLDWKRTNLDWESVIGTKQQELDPDKNVVNQWVSPRASRQAIDGTIGFLKRVMALD